MLRNYYYYYCFCYYYYYYHPVNKSNTKLHMGIYNEMQAVMIPYHRNEELQGSSVKGYFGCCALLCEVEGQLN